MTVLLLTIASVQAQTKRSLHSLLDELSNIYQTTISFSPTITDKVFPANTDLSGGLDAALGRILKGTEFGYKIVGGKFYLIYQLPAKPVEQKAVTKEQPVVAEPESEPEPEQLYEVTIDVSDVCSTIPKIGSSEFEQRAIAAQSVSPTFPLLESQPRLAVKSNLLYDATSTINMGVEVVLSQRTTLDISVNYNQWTFSDNHKMKHWLVQPDFRIWTCTRFSGGFWGIHTHYGQFNWGGMLPWGFNSGDMFGVIENREIKNHRYQGWLVGGGVSYGYHWILGKRWGLEAEIGAGYAYLKYDKFRCEKCGEIVGSEHKNYFGPTKAAVNLVFIIE